MTTEPECNPLAGRLAELSRDLLDSTMDQCELIEILTPCGIEFADDGPSHWRAATTEESCIGSGDLIFEKLAVDFRKPIPQQVSRWLRGIAAGLTAGADAIDLIEDGRDLRAIRRMVKAA